MTNDILNTLVQNQHLFDQYHLTYVALFGSNARNQATSTSDIDLLFDYQTPPSLFELARLKYQLEKLTQKPVDLVSKRSLDPRLKPYIIKDLKVIYEKK